MADDLTPILVGGARFTERISGDIKAARTPLDLVAAAALQAAQDAMGGDETAARALLRDADAFATYKLGPIGVPTIAGGDNVFKNICSVPALAAPFSALPLPLPPPRSPLPLLSTTPHPSIRVGCSYMKVKQNRSKGLKQRHTIVATMMVQTRNVESFSLPLLFLLPFSPIFSPFPPHSTNHIIFNFYLRHFLFQFSLTMKKSMQQLCLCWS